MIFKLSQMSTVSAQNSLALSTPSFIPGSRCMSPLHWVPSCVQRWETSWELTEFFLLPISEQSPVGEDVAGGVKTRSRRWMSVCRSHPPMRGTSTDPNVGRQEVSQSTFSHTSWHRVQCWQFRMIYESINIFNNVQFPSENRGQALLSVLPTCSFLMCGVVWIRVQLCQY